ncbi:DUF5344 family protein [Metabacillus indicus]|uniref:Uncharacterized protein n=1 Tax=Metabacillus indicus TaxID=246786 RepID=A0A084H1A5_METID|nr:DUF5344 family protein [Metabacillus indicus]KEZ53367.1 hypothetical protein GS18_0207150 [Metabacillus indicus]
MEKEIKINYSEVEQSLEDMKASAIMLDMNLEVLDGENILASAKKLDELNKQLVLLTEEYKTLLKVNIQLTKQSVENMHEADKSTAASLK